MYAAPQPPAISVSRKSFTLVELLATIAILAVLVVSALVFIPAYMSWAQSVSDQRTLVILNDALTRYKCEGGDLTALTAQALIPHVLTKLSSPINWAGNVHQVMQTAVTYPAKSLAVAGAGSSYRFTRYNSSTAETGGISPGAGPAYVGIAFNGNCATPMTLTAGIAAGHRAVLVQSYAAGAAPSADMVSVSDSKGNAWTVDIVNHTGINRSSAIASAGITTPLIAGDTVTITFGSGGSGTAWILDLGNVLSSGQPNVVGSVSTGVNTTTLSAPATTTAAPVIVVGISTVRLAAASTAYTELSNGTGGAPSIGAVVFYTTLYSTGSQTISETLTPSQIGSLSWAAYK